MELKLYGTHQLLDRADDLRLSENMNYNEEQNRSHNRR
jgi:hypothetical protein